MFVRQFTASPFTSILKIAKFINIGCAKNNTNCGRRDPPLIVHFNIVEGQLQVLRQQGVWIAGVTFAKLSVVEPVLEILHYI
jgi:hypothetical protein